MMKKAKKIIISVISAIIMLSPLSITGFADMSESGRASYCEGKNQAYHQMIIEYLMPQIDEAVRNYYKDYLSYLPGVSPFYGGKVLCVKYVDSEIEKNISHSFEVIVQVTPYFGPHISVGKDNLTFRVFVTDGIVMLEKFEHVESHEIPPHHRDIIINEWPPKQ